MKNKPSYDGARLIYCTPDPFGYGRFLAMFSDGTGLLVMPNGSGSRWLEEPEELRQWTAAGRVAWDRVPVAAQAEVQRRCVELDSFLDATDQP
jgi:hypothetical protein